MIIWTEVFYCVLFMINTGKGMNPRINSPLRIRSSSQISHNGNWIYLLFKLLGPGIDTGNNRKMPINKHLPEVSEDVNNSRNKSPLRIRSVSDPRSVNQNACKTCCLSFATHADLTKHISSHIKCPECAFSASPKIVYHHSQSVHGTQYFSQYPFKCYSCSKGFSEQSHLDNHLRQHVKCDICSFSALADIMESHSASHFCIWLYYRLFLIFLVESLSHNGSHINGESNINNSNIWLFLLFRFF